MKEESKKFIRYAFWGFWILSVLLLVYRLSVRPVVVNLDLSFIINLLPNITDGGDNYFL